jgi:hypothetical protein
VQRGLADRALDCWTTVPGSIPPPGTPPSKKLQQEAPAQKIFSAHRKKHPSEENLMRMNLVKYCIVKVEKINLKECREGHQIIIIKVSPSMYVIFFNGSCAKVAVC